MELDASLSWLALALTPGLAARLSARLLKEFGSPDEVFRASLPKLEACKLPGPVAQAVFKKQAVKRGKRISVDAAHGSLPATELSGIRVPSRYMTRRYSCTSGRRPSAHAAQRWSGRHAASGQARRNQRPAILRPSTITTPSGSPATIRLRMGKFSGAGCVPRGNSLRIAPRSSTLS
jgi:hypothetical protein